MPDIITEMDIERASKNIINALRKMTEDLEGDDLIRYVYNKAIEDAANFAVDVAPRNPMASSTLYAIANEIREKLPLAKPKREN